MPIIQHFDNCRRFRRPQSIIGKRLRAWQLSQGITRSLTLHDLRRGLAQKVFMATKDVAMVKSLLSHSSLRSTFWYLHGGNATLTADTLNLAKEESMTTSALALTAQASIDSKTKASGGCAAGETFLNSGKMPLSRHRCYYRCPVCDTRFRATYQPDPKCLSCCPSCGFGCNVAHFSAPQTRGGLRVPLWIQAINERQAAERLMANDVARKRAEMDNIPASGGDTLDQALGAGDPEPIDLTGATWVPFPQSSRFCPICAAPSHGESCPVCLGQASICPVCAEVYAGDFCPFCNENFEGTIIASTSIFDSELPSGLVRLSAAGSPSGEKRRRGGQATPLSPDGVKVAGKYAMPHRSEVDGRGTVRVQGPPRRGQAHVNIPRAASEPRTIEEAAVAILRKPERRRPGA